MTLKEKVRSPSLMEIARLVDGLSAMDYFAV